MEGFLPDAGHALGNYNVDQGRTQIERIVSDAGYAIGNHNARDSVVAFKQPVRDLRHALGNADVAGSRGQHGDDLRSVRAVDDAVRDFQEFPAFVFDVGQVAAAFKSAFSQRFQGGGQGDGGQVFSIAESMVPDDGHALRNHDAMEPAVIVKQAMGDFRHALGNADIAGGRGQHGDDLRPIRAVDDSIHGFQNLSAFVLDIGQIAAAAKSAFFQSFQCRGQYDGGQVFTTVERIHPDTGHTLGNHHGGNLAIAVKCPGRDGRHALGNADVAGGRSQYSDDSRPVCAVDDAVHGFQECAAFVLDVGQIAAAFKNVCSQGFQRRGQRDGGQVFTPAERAVSDTGHALGNHHGGNLAIAVKSPSRDGRHALGNADFTGNVWQYLNDFRPVRAVNNAVHDFQEFAALVFDAGQVAAAFKNVCS